MGDFVSNRPDFDLSGRVAVVVGGTSGIGLSIARAFAASGASVVPCSRRRDLVKNVTAELSAAGCQTMEHPCDATDIAAVDELVSAVVRRFGRLDILVNSAGLHLKKPALDVRPEEWDRLENTNLRSVFFACQSAARVMRERQSGSIINIASMGSFLHFPEVSVYCIGKAGVAQLTRSLGVEWAPLGIRVNAIAPGFFLTPLNERALADEDRRAKIIARTPAGRLGELDELRGAAVYLASEASRFVTGTILPVDGGFLARGF